jgi:hypothetical protein
MSWPGATGMLHQQHWRCCRWVLCADNQLQAALAQVFEFSSSCKLQYQLPRKSISTNTVHSNV